MKSELELRNERLISDISRVIDDVVSLDELKAMLDSGKKLNIKYGVDCTAPFLHLGHATNLWPMRRFQECGHKVIFLIGNFTSKIGDPTGRSATRKVLTDEEIEANAAEFIRQIGKVLITDNPDVFEIRRNAEWYDKMPLSRFIELCSMVTHTKMIKRDMFKKRIDEGNDIYINEMLYPVLQGYDSVMLESDLTIVGTDQLFNEMMGRFYQEKFGQVKQVVMTTKITKGLWGEDKQSKSIGNYVALTDTSKDMFGKVMTLTDDRILNWMEVYTDIDLEEINYIGQNIASGKMNPRDAKIRLAHAIVERYYGTAVADAEKAHFINTFSKRSFPADAPVVRLKADAIDLVSLIETCDGTVSRSQIRTLIKQGAVTLNGEKKTNHSEIIKLEPDNKLKIGKLKFFRVLIE